MPNSPELRKPVDWQNEFKFRVFDPDGWRSSSTLGAKDWDEPITRAEYEQRLGECTVASNRNYHPTI